MTRLTVGDLFAGIGGFSLASERAGLATRWQVEIDPAARSVLSRHWPNVRRYDDVLACHGHALEPVDIITAGFPCQDLSVAGKRAGMTGERSGLFWEIIRIVKEMREATDGRLPAILLLENVPGWLSSHRGRDFGRALDALAECGALDIGWSVLDAQWFGVPQRRRRVFVVADFRGERADEILALSDSLRGHPPTRREAGQAVARTIGRRAGGGSGPGPAEAAQGLIINGSNQVVASAITASAGHHGRSSPRGDGADTLIVEQTPSAEVAATIRGGTPGERGYHSPKGRVDDNPIAFSCKDAGADAGEIAPTLRAMNHDQSWLNGGGQVAVAFDTTQITSPLNDPAPQAGDPCHPLAAGAHAPAIAHQAGGVRRLTPTECERLQGYPDCFTDGHADSHRYRLLGNSVCVNVVTWLLERARAALELA